MHIRPPLAPHPDTMTSVHHIISADAGAAGEALVVYCPRHHCGGVYFAALGFWSLYAPIPLAEFLRVLDGRGVVVDAAAQDAWLLAVGSVGSGAVN